LLQEARLCNPFSPRANRLLGEVLLRARDPAAGAALAAGLRWLNPDDRPAHQLEVGVLCVAAGDIAAAQRWLHPLFAASPPRLETLLGRLYEAVPVSELLAVLLPPEPREVREALAGLLLRHGEFAGRERELAVLRGDAVPSLLTVADGVLLRECTIEPGREGTTVTQAVTLSFELAPGVQPPPLALRCETSGAAVFRPFTPAAEPFRYTIRLDPTFPPGEYSISLSFRGDAPFLPLGRASIAGTELELGADGVHAAETCLYWETADPGRRLRPRTGVPLRPGDCLWRDVVLPAGATTLVLRTGAPVQPAVYFGEQELRCLSARGSLVHRFALPAAGAGRLSIQGGAGEVLVQDFFVAGRREQ
jgi:hypothetical protein